LRERAGGRGAEVWAAEIEVAARSRSLPQRLKPRLMCRFAARLKPCPDTSCFPDGIFLQAVRAETFQEERALRQPAGALEGLYGLGLDGVDLADGDGGDVEVFAACGRAGEAAEHGELADVGERVGDGALHEPLDGRLNGRG